MAAKRGRKSAYETRIKPRFNEISEWLANGATEKQIAYNLGIAGSTFEKYKAEKTEFSELIKNGRKNLVYQLRGALVKKALGFDYEETKKTRKIEPDGGITVSVETYHKKALPDVAALNLCLKNYDSENWANDPQVLEIKKQELELRREIADRDSW